MTRDTPANAPGPVLVVEDNLLIAEGVEMQLGLAGYPAVDRAVTVDRALELIEADPPICAILDLKLANGQTSEAVAQDLANRNIPFVFLTGFGEDTPMLDQFPEVTVLTKPLPQEDLTAALQQMLKR